MVYLVKAMVFPIVIHGCDSWNIKKAKSQRKKSVTIFTFSPSICHEVMGLDAMILAFEC